MAVTIYNTQIIVARYNEEIQWVDKLREYGFHVKVYEKLIPHSLYYIPVNKGQECPAYLKYIIDNYNNLSTYTIFLHGHEKAWHVDGSIVDRIMENLGASHNYFSLNNNVMNRVLNQPWASELLQYYREYLQSELGPSDVYGDWTEGYKGSAQFIVHKHLILSRPKDFYERLYTWVMTSPLENAKTSSFMEWTWHLIWNQVPKNF